MIQSSIAPGLLLAMPQLVDPNFKRAVVLMIEHNDNGSFGLVVNQPLAMTASELMGSIEMVWNGVEEDPVWKGGPVQPSSGWILHEPMDHIPAPKSGTLEICSNLVLSTSPDTLRTLGEQPPPRVRLFMGYSGWGPGQLASEMARGSWLHVDVDPDIIFDTPPSAMWERALRTLGIEPQTIVPGFGIH